HRDAPPGGQTPSSSGAQMNTGTTGPPRRLAACSAGLSARRKSCRSQTTAGATPALGCLEGLTGRVITIPRATNEPQSRAAALAQMGCRRWLANSEVIASGKPVARDIHTGGIQGAYRG